MNAPMVLPSDADAITGAALTRTRRVLLTGAPGSGKSTLAARIGATLSAQGRACWCVAADPGSPAFGVPGAVALGRWASGGWHCVSLAALCSLDAGRFRLPLVNAVRRLAMSVCGEMLLIDGPGVVRGVAGSELLEGLVNAAGTDLVLALSRAGEPPPLIDTLRALNVDVLNIACAEQAVRPGKRSRARQRTALWDRYLADATEHVLDIAALALIGTPPPHTVPSAWTGRQIAMLAANATVALGEVIALDAEGRLRARLPALAASPTTLLVRDALRGAHGLLETAAPFAPERFEVSPGTAPTTYDETLGVSAPLVGRVGSLDVTLLNGVLGDPLLHVRLQHQRRSLLFDLGEGRRLTARTAHEVSDVFITHAHIDHIGGFLWLLRSRIGELPVCRFYGPPGLANNIDGLLRGILWDRVGERAPRFEVFELHGERLLRFTLRAGQEMRAASEAARIMRGVVYADPGFRVRAIELDHGTPVLAYALEPTRQINVRKERLAARHLTPGPWLGTLKECLLAEDLAAPIALPDGTIEPAGALGAELTLITPAKRLVYATDFADTPANRARLIELARDAHTLFCEASFMEADCDQAQRTGHLTARACGEIASAAGVARLVPFHFSRRYAHDLSAAHDEVNAACARTVSILERERPEPMPLQPPPHE